VARTAPRGPGLGERSPLPPSRPLEAAGALLPLLGLGLGDPERLARPLPPLALAAIRGRLAPGRARRGRRLVGTPGPLGRDARQRLEAGQRQLLGEPARAEVARATERRAQQRLRDARHHL